MVKSNLVKLETSCRVILPPTESVLWSNLCILTLGRISTDHISGSLSLSLSLLFFTLLYPMRLALISTPPCCYYDKRRKSSNCLSSTAQSPDWDFGSKYHSSSSLSKYPADAMKNKVPIVAACLHVRFLQSFADYAMG